MAEKADSALTGRLRALEDDAWSEVAGKYGNRLLAFVRLRFGCDRQRAEEIVQMAFTRAVKSIRTFDPAKGGILPWLKAIAANEGHTLARREARVASRPLIARSDDGVENALALIDKAPLPEEILCRRELQELVRLSLSKMDEGQAELLVMKYIEGLSVRGIAREKGATEKSVESSLTRARAALKRELRRLGEDLDWEGL